MLKQKTTDSLYLSTFFILADYNFILSEKKKNYLGGNIYLKMSMIEIQRAWVHVYGNRHERKKDEATSIDV
jgi:hypothetical protein